MAYSRKSKASREERRERVEAASKELREKIVDELVKSMEEDGPEWVKEWSVGYGSPRNPFTGTVYRGANVWALLAQMKQRGFKDARFCTFNNAKEMGWHVRRGEHGCAVEYWKPVSFDDNKDPENPDRTDHIHSRWNLVSVSKVFNFEQIEGAPALEPAEPLPDHELYQVADMLKESSRCSIFEEPSDNAFFAPLKDEIHVPERAQFSRPEAFVSTLLHEMAHSTGVPNGRPLVGYLQNEESYAREELVAELSATLSSAMLGIGYDYAGGLDKDTQEYQNHVAYLKHWAGHLRENPDVLFKCSNEAQKATDYLIVRYDEVAESHGMPRQNPDRELKEEYDRRQAARAEGRDGGDGKAGAEDKAPAPVKDDKAPERAEADASATIGQMKPRGFAEQLRDIAANGPTQESIDALNDRYYEIMDAVREKAVDGLAAWGEQVSLGGGRFVSTEDFCEAAGFAPWSREARALAATGYALAAFDKDPMQMASLIEASGGRRGIDGYLETVPKGELPILSTFVEPSMFSADELKVMAEVRPDLFGAGARERYPEVARAAREVEAERAREGAGAAREGCGEEPRAAEGREGRRDAGGMDR